MEAKSRSYKKKTERRGHCPWFWGSSVWGKGTIPPLSSGEVEGGFSSRRQMRKALRKSLKDSRCLQKGASFPGWIHTGLQSPRVHMHLSTGAKPGETILRMEATHSQRSGPCTMSAFIVSSIGAWRKGSLTSVPMLGDPRRRLHLQGLMGLFCDMYRRKMGWPLPNPSSPGPLEDMYYHPSHSLAP